MRAFASCRSAESSPLLRAFAVLGVIVGFASSTPTALALEVHGAPGTLQIHGFLTQAYVLTSGNNFFGKSQLEDGGSFSYRELGINGSWRVHPRLQLSAQGLSRWAGEGDKGVPSVDFAYFDYTAVSDAHNLWGIRVGRTAIPLGLYNQTRDVASTRPSVLLPQSIYFDRTRDLALSGDGGYLHGERRSHWGNVFFEAGAGFPRSLNEEAEFALVGFDAPGSLEGRLSYVGRLLYEKDEGAWRAAVSSAQVHIDYDPASAGDPIRPGSFRFRPLILSVQMNRERLSLTGEYALRFFRTDGFARNTKLTGESYYLQAAYRFAQGWEAMARYDALYSDRQDRDGKDFEAQTRGTVPAHTRFARDFTLGLRWDITPQWMTRVEYHMVDGTAWLPRLDNRDATDLERHWSLFSALASFHF